MNKKHRKSGAFLFCLTVLFFFLGKEEKNQKKKAEGKQGKEKAFCRKRHPRFGCRLCLTLPFSFLSRLFFCFFPLKRKKVPLSQTAPAFWVPFVFDVAHFFFVSAFLLLLFFSRKEKKRKIFK